MMALTNVSSHLYLRFLSYLSFKIHSNIQLIRIFSFLSGKDCYYSIVSSVFGLFSIVLWICFYHSFLMGCSLFFSLYFVYTKHGIDSMILVLYTSFFLFVFKSLFFSFIFLCLFSNLLLFLFSQFVSKSVSFSHHHQHPVFQMTCFADVTKNCNRNVEKKKIFFLKINNKQKINIYL